MAGPSGIASFSPTPATNATADGGSSNWAENQLPSTVNNTARQNLADIRTAFNDLVWFSYGSGDQASGATFLGTPYTYASSTSVSIAGVDVTAVHHAGRRMKFVGSSTGTIYGTIASSSFSTNTTINLTWDSGSLSNETLTGYLSQIPVTGNPVGAGSITGSFSTLTASGLITATAGVHIGAGTQPSGAIFDITPASRTGTGTVTNSASGTAVTGSGTTFTKDFIRGSAITANAETQYVVNVVSDTSLTTTVWTGANSGVAYTIPLATSTLTSYQSGLNAFGTGVTSTFSSPIGVYRQATLPVAYSGTMRGVDSRPGVAATGAASTLSLIGVEGAPTISATNTQNLTNATSLVGVSSGAGILASATGTITGIAAFNYTGAGNLASGATLTNFYGLRLPSVNSTGPITNIAQVAIEGTNTSATNNTAISIAAGNNVNVIQTGNWGINDQSARNWTMTGANFTIASTTTVAIGGAASTGLLFSSTSAFGIYFGSSAPLISAAKGSLYLRTDGTTTNDRAYINTNGSTAWTALTTAS